MSIFRFILYTIIFYLVIKAVKFFIRYIRIAGNKNQGTRANSFNNKKYSNIEEAQYTEIKSDMPSGREEKNSSIDK